MRISFNDYGRYRCPECRFVFVVNENNVSKIIGRGNRTGSFKCVKCTGSIDRYNQGVQSCHFMLQFNCKFCGSKYSNSMHGEINKWSVWPSDYEEKEYYPSSVGYCSKNCRGLSRYVFLLLTFFLCSEEVPLPLTELLHPEKESRLKDFFNSKMFRMYESVFKYRIAMKKFRKRDKLRREYERTTK